MTLFRCAAFELINARPVHVSAPFRTTASEARASMCVIYINYAWHRVDCHADLPDIHLMTCHLRQLEPLQVVLAFGCLVGGIDHLAEGYLLLRHASYATCPGQWLSPLETTLSETPYLAMATSSPVLPWSARASTA